MSTPRDAIRALIRDTIKRFPGISYEEVMSPSKVRKVVRARWACMVAVKAAHPEFSYPRIGRIFGRDHSSVLYGMSADRRLRKAATRTIREQSGRSAPAMSIGVAAE